jgi:glycosyltransferase involved in cell wall biosynthesis
MLHVIIPHYNDYSNLERALTSLTLQTLPNFKTTIVDDCSPSPCLVDEIYNKFKTKLPILKLIKLDKNEGPGHARQVGIDSCDLCDYIMFLDSDDLLYPYSTKLLYSEAQKNFSDVLQSNITCEIGDSSIQVLQGDSATTWCHGKIYRKKFLEDIGLNFNLTEFKYNEDSYFNLCAVFLAEKRGNLDVPTYFWKSNPKSLTREPSDQPFIYKYNKDYIYSQCCAIEFCLEKTTKFLSLCKTISNIYEAYELEYLVNPQNIEIVNERLYKLFSNAKLIEILLNEKTLQEITTCLRGAKQINKDLIFFQHSFSDFLNFFTKSKII